MDEPICLAGYPRARDKLHPLLLQDLKMPQEEVMDSGDVWEAQWYCAAEPRKEAQMSEVNSLQCELPPSRQEIIDWGSVPFSAVARFLFCYFTDAPFFI